MVDTNLRKDNLVIPNPMVEAIRRDARITVDYTKVVMGKAQCCSWCGRVKTKKVKGTGADGRPILVCQEHFRRVDSKELVNEPTAHAIAGTWETKVEQSNRSRR